MPSAPRHLGGSLFLLVKNFGSMSDIGCSLLRMGGLDDAAGKVFHAILVSRLDPGTAQWALKPECRHDRLSLPQQDCSMMMGKVFYQLCRSLQCNDKAKCLIEINQKTATVTTAWPFPWGVEGLSQGTGARRCRDSHCNRRAQGC